MNVEWPSGELTVAVAASLCARRLMAKPDHHAGLVRQRWRLERARQARPVRLSCAWVTFYAPADTQTPLYFLRRGDDIQLSLVGRTQACGRSAAGMSLVCWDFTLYDSRVAVVSCAPPPVAV